MRAGIPADRPELRAAFSRVTKWSFGDKANLNAADVRALLGYIVELLDERAAESAGEPPVPTEGK